MVHLQYGAGASFSSADVVVRQIESMYDFYM